MDAISRGVCPTCGRRMEVLPRTVLGGRPGPGHRWAYENYDCAPCDLRISWLIRDPVPAGTA